MARLDTLGNADHAPREVLDIIERLRPGPKVDLRDMNQPDIVDALGRDLVELVLIASARDFRSDGARQTMHRPRRTLRCQCPRPGSVALLETPGA